MKIIYQHLIIPLLLLSGSGCSASPNKNTLLIYKSSGAIQCQPGSGLTPLQMKTQLTAVGVNVWCEHTTRDGLYRMAMCGAQNGQINIFKIAQSDLDVARKAGFLTTEKLPASVLKGICE